MAVLKVGIVVHERVQALDVAGPIDVFAEANAYVAAENRYETIVIGPHRRPLRASNNMLIMADLAFSEVDGGFDILLVAGGPALLSEEPDMELIDWLALAPARASTYGSICTGAFALGHAGLLDGRRATTHWQMLACWRQSFRQRKSNRTRSMSAMAAS